jgi:hypothetical protein
MTVREGLEPMMERKASSYTWKGRARRVEAVVLGGTKSCVGVSCRPFLYCWGKW